MNVQFEENKEFQYSKEKGITGFLISTKIVNNKTQASILLLIVSIVSIVSAFFILRSDNQPSENQLSDFERKQMLAEEGIYE